METKVSKNEYYRSEIGEIPIDWKVKRINEIAEVNTNTIKSSVQKDYEFFYYDLSAVDKGKVYHPDKKIRLSDAPSRAKRLFEKNNILMSTVRPNLQGFTFVDFDTDDCVCSTGFAVVEGKDKSDSMYLYQNLYSEGITNQIKRLLVGSNYPAINGKDVENLKIPYPKDKSERERISYILSTWDNAIDLKGKLIEQKKEQKKGLMENLLTGKVRMPGFEGAWQEVKLGSILKERRETGYVHLELLAITSQKGVVRRTEVDIKDNSSDDKSKYKRILPNDIGYNTMRMWQGVSGVSKYEGIVSPAYTILQPLDEVDANFMGYLFKLPKVVNLFKRYSQGLVSDTLNLKYENLKKIKVIMPIDIKEQQAISDVLMCIDNEIEFLQSEIDTFRLQKKGLMQLLLTGKVRVKV